MKTIRIALLHLEPRPGQLKHNCRLIETAIGIAAERGARWIVTAEMCVSGYFFREVIGTDWIEAQPDSWMRHLLEVAREKQLTIFLSYPNRDIKTDRCYNSLFVLGSDGQIKGACSKIDVHPGPEEDWSTPGTNIEPVDVDGVRIGLLICADVQHADKALALRKKGAELLVCSMAWGHKYHPGDRWEKRSAETGIPVIVCNRTGREKMVDWTKSDSIVAKDGRRLLQATVDRSAVLLFDWELDTMSPLSTRFEIVYLDS
jgi:predicted amidohydrolase